MSAESTHQIELSGPIAVRKDLRFPGETHASDVWRLRPDGRRGLRIARLHYSRNGTVFLCFNTQIFDSPEIARAALEAFVRASCSDSTSDSSIAATLSRSDK